MKQKSNIVLRQVAEAWVLLPLGKEILDFNGILSLNETGAFIWRLLEKECTKEIIAEELTKEYQVSYSEALTDVEEYLSTLVKAGCVE